ncbi:MAG: Asp-tRNA(Asn)/Glu-tRNA(Gln) amidotransferase subunit GatC [candidate division WS1 bacterium]|jgi:aspartyl-tRNA(Asn)/glutamyl-tRNA(Gln) amidotransferase subunit C|nr:Asp-tRNA(Asn)/Glu-tRNA(Gln) amidotransferase subunit GatC [candidate division WS1 bacterium]
MPDVSREVVEHVSMLARLALSSEEINRLQHEMGRILEHADKLQAVNTDDIPGISHVIPMTNVYREDQVGPSLTPEEVVANAPESADEFFKVPRTVEE